MIRQAIAATAESCCDGAVTAVLVLCSRAALRAGAESVVAEELEQNLFPCVRYQSYIQPFSIYYSATFVFPVVCNSALKRPNS